MPAKVTRLSDWRSISAYRVQPLRDGLKTTLHFEEAYEQGRDTYRQTLEEQIIQMTLLNKNPAGLIYLLKAKFKMWDQPNKNETASVAVDVKYVMVVRDHGTDADW